MHMDRRANVYYLFDILQKLASLMGADSYILYNQKRENNLFKS